MADLRRADRIYDLRHLASSFHYRNIWNGIPCDSFCDHTDLCNGTDSYFAVLARFDNTIKNTAKNALLFCVGKLPQAVLMLILTLIPAILLTVSYRFISVDFLIGLSGPAYLAAIYFADLFKAYEEEETVE